MEEFNSALTRAAGNKGDSSTIEAARQATNIRWQTRWAPLSPFEELLAATLQEIFAAGIYDLPLIVRELNARGIEAPGNTPVWTEQGFIEEIARLAHQPQA